MVDNYFEKNMTEAFTNKMDNKEQNKVISDVIFTITGFDRIEKEDIQPERIDLENWGIFDPGKYKKQELQIMIKGFLSQMDVLTFRKRVKKIKHQNFIKNNHQIYAIQPEFYELLSQFVSEKSKEPRVRFKKVTVEHICFIQKLMNKQDTRNETIAQKTRRLRQAFGISLSTGTVQTIQRKVLRYSYKRIATFIPKYLGNKILKSISFIQKFLKIIENENKILLVLDEVGWGTQALRHYAYSRIGEPVIYKKSKQISKNLTLTVTISPNCVEYIQCFVKGGTKSEYFSYHFENLVEKMLIKYPSKTVVILLDNLASHKSQQIIKIVQDEERLQLLCTPSNSPQFSPIENMFGFIKRQLKDKSYRSKEELACLVINAMFALTKSQIHSFYQKTLNNMIDFWYGIKDKRNQILQEINILQ